MESLLKDLVVLDEVPVIDFQTFFDKNNEEAWRMECKKVA